LLVELKPDLPIGLQAIVSSNVPTSKSSEGLRLRLQVIEAQDRVQKSLRCLTWINNPRDTLQTNSSLFSSQVLEDARRKLSVIETQERNNSGKEARLISLPRTSGCLEASATPSLVRSRKDHPQDTDIMVSSTQNSTANTLKKATPRTVKKKITKTPGKKGETKAKPSDRMETEATTITPTIQRDNTAQVDPSSNESHNNIPKISDMEVENMASTTAKFNTIAEGETFVRVRTPTSKPLTRHLKNY
jgi:hypothetical protein